MVHSKRGGRGRKIKKEESGRKIKEGVSDSIEDKKENQKETCARRTDVVVVVVYYLTTTATTSTTFVTQRIDSKEASQR